MRHLKRFKNWLAVVYYACWTYSQQFRAQADKDESHSGQVESDDRSVSQVTSSRADVPEKISEPVVEMPASNTASVEVKKSSAPQPKVIAKPEAPKPQAPAVSMKVQVPQTPAKPKSNGTPVTAQQTSNAKYQPGAINDQTAQRLARLLVSEIKLYYKSKSEGDNSIDTANIYDLLKDPIEKSRKHYNQRMGQSAIESMPDYFHGELVRTLCGGDASRLGPNYPAGKGA